MTGKKKKPFFTPARIKRLIVWSVLLVLIGAGFGYQKHIHSDSYITSYFKEHKSVYEDTVAALGDLTVGNMEEGSDGRRILPDGKVTIESLINNPQYKDIQPQLEAARSIGIQDVKCDGETYMFYQSRRFVIIFGPSDDSKEIGGGWSYQNYF